MRLRHFLLALPLLSATSLTWASEDILRRADALIRLQAPDKAYALLEPLEDELAGNAQYDYLLGLALLEQGKPQTAIFAFERCLTVEPKNGPCRVQMARTHLALGEASNARAEFEIINEYNPPAEIKALANQYLGAIADLEAKQKRRINAYAQVGVGFDSNINGAPEDANKTAAALPKFNGVQINPNSIITSDDSGFANLNAGASIAYKFNPDLIGLADISTQTRSFFSDNNFDYQSIDVGIGSSFNLETFNLITKLQAQKMWLSGDAYRDVIGGLVQIQTEVANGQASLFRQNNTLSYDTQSTRDGKRNTTGLAYSRAFDAEFNPSFYLSIYQGDENISNTNVNYLSHQLKGVRVGGGLRVIDSLSVNLQLSQEKREHNKSIYTSFFNVYRADTENNANLNANWRINKHFSLIPSYNYTDNQSNIPFSDFTRHTVSVDLRFDL